jgi:diguanylate cyclase (GGDEF)-like protein
MPERPGLADGDPPRRALGAWWRGLMRDEVWLTVVRDLQAHVRTLVGADTLALWARLPPTGEWLRVAWQLRWQPVLLPPDVEPHASLERRLAPQRYRTADIDGPYRRLLDRAGVVGGWLLPLASPLAADGNRQWVGVLGVGWRRSPPDHAPSPVGLASVVWYLLGQRMEDLYTEAVLEAAAGLRAPATGEEWQGLMAALATWLGGDQWALFRVAPRADAPVAVSLVGERGALPGRGARVASFLNAHPEALDRSALWRGARQRRVTFVADTALSDLGMPDVAAGDGPAADDGRPARSLLVMPLGSVRGGDHGALVAYWRVVRGWERHGLSVRPWEAVRRVAGDWWQGMGTSHDAAHDALTGALNRHGIAAAWRRGTRRRASGLVGICDLDLLRHLNNRWGHLMGDEALRAAAAALADAAQPHGGWVGRWGGDEFVVFLPARVDWPRLGEEVQARLDAEAAERGWPARVTLSGGASLWHRVDDDWEGVLARADRALYRAKRRGRGRFVLGA